jgi:hypothetical protein
MTELTDQEMLLVNILERGVNDRRRFRADNVSALNDLDVPSTVWCGAVFQRKDSFPERLSHERPARRRDARFRRAVYEPRRWNPYDSPLDLCDVPIMPVGQHWTPFSH